MRTPVTPSEIVVGLDLGTTKVSAVVGEVDAKLFTGVFVWRDGQPRFISVRRANRAEERDYRNPG